MKVERIETANGSHIEPALEEDWDDLTKLRWKAAVVADDGGFPDDALWVESEGIRRWFYIYTLPPGVTDQTPWGPLSFTDAWYHLNSIQEGARLARHRESAS